jgi:hypothetical protein
VATGVAIDAANKAVSLHAPAPLAHPLKAERIAEPPEIPQARALRDVL